MKNGAKKNRKARTLIFENVRRRVVCNTGIRYRNTPIGNTPLSYLFVMNRMILRSPIFSYETAKASYELSIRKRIMNLAKRTVLALEILSEIEVKKTITATSIVKTFGTYREPAIRAVLDILTKGNVLKSERGREGGYRLGIKLEDVTIQFLDRLFSNTDTRYMKTINEKLVGISVKDILEMEGV